MNRRIAAQAATMSREQAENLGRYPELLARMVDILSQQLHARVADLKGVPGEYLDVMIVAEVRYLDPEDDQ